MPEATTGGVLQKKVLFKMSQNSQEASPPEETSTNFAKLLRTIFLKKHLWTTASEMQTLQ